MTKTTLKQTPKLVYAIFESILATSGILINKITPLRLLVIVLILLNVILTYFFRSYITLNFAIGYFIFMYIVRYWLLFGAFGEQGFSENLKKKYGEEKGYAFYEAITAFLFFYRSTSFTFLVEETANPVAIWGDFSLLVSTSAWGMMIIATVVNIWATLIIGIDVYYYKDMFVGRPIGHFEVKGPFRYFSNPMYGIGQFNAYGLALLSGSFWGILATALNQVTMYIFYYLYEKPHIERLFGKNDSFELDKLKT